MIKWKKKIIDYNFSCFELSIHLSLRIEKKTERSNFRVSGHRIIDFETLRTNMICQKCKCELSLNSIVEVLQLTLKLQEQTWSARNASVSYHLIALSVNLQPVSVAFYMWDVLNVVMFANVHIPSNTGININQRLISTIMNFFSDCFLFFSLIIQV